MMKFRPWLALLTLALVAPLSGCGLLMELAREETEVLSASQSKDLLLVARTAKSVYRPGEAVVVEVELYNSSDKTWKIRTLNASTAPPVGATGSLTFFSGLVKSTRKIQHFPVVSRREEATMKRIGAATQEIGPGETIRRKFVHTQMTERPGSFNLQVHMEPYWGMSANRSGKIFSSSISYEVYGAPLLARDSRGLIKLEEAIGIATAAAPGDVNLVDAVLTDDEMGFQKWWINVEFTDAEGEAGRAGYLVDPYFGRIWRETAPFGPHVRPDTAPPVINSRRRQSS